MMSFQLNFELLFTFFVEEEKVFRGSCAPSHLPKKKMLKLSQKRTRDWPEDVTPLCAPHRILTLDSPYNKRQKPQDVENMSVSRENSSPNRRDSPFQFHDEQNPAELVLKRKLKFKTEEERSFTYEQVREIVNRALADKETALRAEYDQILQERLQDQFRNFSKFNEDYISRQLK